MRNKNRVTVKYVSSSRKQLAILFSLVAIIFLTGCGGGASRQAIRTQYYPFSESDKVLQEQAKNAVYRFSVGDIFSVDFKYEDELDQKFVLILPDGNITVSGVGVLPAAGFSVSELDSCLTYNYGLDYKNPDLSILVSEVATQKVYVLGEVQEPGIVDLHRGGSGVLQTISLAGGFTKHARTSEVLIIRVTPEGYMYRICDLSDLQIIGLEGIGYLDIQPFDVVYVPRSSLGNLKYFSETVLQSMVQISSLFWDIYAMSNLSKISNIVR